MKKLLWVLISGALLFLSCTTSKRISFLIEPEAKPGAGSGIDIDACEAKYGQYDGVFLSIEHTIEHSGSKENPLAGSLFAALSSSWSYLRMVQRKYVVFNPDATWLTSFTTYGKPDKLYLHVITPQGEVRRYGVKDLKKEKDEEGYTVYRLIYPDIVKGTIIEEGYEYSYNVVGYPPPLEYDIPLELRLPCEHLKVKFACPSWWKLRVKRYAENENIAYRDSTDNENSKTILTYEKSDIPAVEKEPFAPYFKECAKYFQFMITELAMASMTYKHPEDWPDLIKKFRERLDKNAKKGADEAAEKAREITAGLTVPLEQVAAVLDYFYDEIDIVLGSGKRSCLEVLNKKEGSPVEVCVLFKEMLKSLSITADMLIVHSANDGFFDRYFVSGEQLYIPAVRVTLGDDFYVLFPYMKNLPLDHTPEFFQDQPCLVLSDSVQQLFWRLPPGNRANNTQDEDYILTIGENGSISVKETQTLRGEQAYTVRVDLEDLNEEDTKKLVKDRMTYTDGDIELLSYKIIDKDEYRQPLKIELEYTIENLVMVTPDEVVFQTGGLFSPLSGAEYKLEAEKRRFPIRIDYNERFNKNIRINFPESWTVTNAPEEFQYENIFGNAERSYESNGNSINISQSLILNRTLQDKEKINDLIELVGSTSRLNMPNIIFSVKQI